MTQTIDELILQLKAQVIECLHIDDDTAARLHEDTPLFGEETGLDSIDALELVVMLDKKYGIKVTDSKVARKILENLRSVAEYVHANRSL